MPDNNYRGLHCVKINCLTGLNESFKQQSDDRIKLTMFSNLGKTPLLPWGSLIKSKLTKISVL